MVEIMDNSLTIFITMGLKNWGGLINVALNTSLIFFLVKKILQVLLVDSIYILNLK